MPQLLEVLLVECLATELFAFLEGVPQYGLPAPTVDVMQQRPVVGCLNSYLVCLWIYRNHQVHQATHLLESLAGLRSNHIRNSNL